MKCGTVTSIRQAMVSALVCSAALPSLAQEPAQQERRSAARLEEVVVTARKREESLQDVSISITALAEETIQKLDMEGFRDWSDYVPGITMFQGVDANRRTGPSATIRGVTHTGRGQLSEGTSSMTTSFMIGQVPLFNADPFLYDLNRVEVLRGPQGTLFGVASMGGTIRFIPNDARTDGFEAELGAGGGSITHGSNTYKLEGMVNLPLIEDKLAIRVAVQHRRNNGFIDHYLPPLGRTGGDLTVDDLVFDPTQLNVATTGGILTEFNGNVLTDSNKSQKTGARFALTWTPTDDFSLKASSTWQDSRKDNVDWVVFNDPRDEPTNMAFTLSPRSDRYNHSSLEASYDLGLGELVFVGGLYNSDNDEVFPFTETGTIIMNILRGGNVLDMDGPGGLPPDPYPVGIPFPFVTESTIRSGEVRFQDDNKSLGINLLGDDMTFDYVIGAYYQEEKRHGSWGWPIPQWNSRRGPNTGPILTEGGLIFASVGGANYDNLAFFGDVTLNLTDRLSIGGGLRAYEHELYDNESCSYGDLAVPGFAEGDDLTTQSRECDQIDAVKEEDTTARITASFQIDDEKMIYTTASQGKRLGLGGANPDWPDNLDTPLLPECRALIEELNLVDAIRAGVASDTVWSYELGLKSHWADGRLMVNTAVYQLDWQDYQQTVLLAHFTPNCQQIITGNVGEARIRGLELEAVFAFSEELVFNTAIAYTDGEFLDPPPGTASGLPGEPLKEGDGLRGVAPLTVAAGAEYVFTDNVPFFGNRGSAYFRVDHRYVAERMNNFGDEDLLKQHPVRKWYFMDPYQLTDVRLGLDSQDMSFQLYVSNVFDEQAMFESSQNFQQPALRVGGSNQPRTIGLNVMKRFGR